MRIGFFYPDFCVRHDFDPNNLWDSSRGMTGSEISCFSYAINLAKKGHEVTLFSRFPHAGNTYGVTLCPYKEWEDIYCKQDWGALLSWMDPRPLALANNDVLKIFNQQVSDFFSCPVGWEDYVDILTPLSYSHADYLMRYTSFPKEKIKICYNGVDLKDFKPSKKVKNKVVWASSHDRGLHRLLEIWPRIISEVPDASLHIFYDFSGLDAFCNAIDFNNKTERGVMNTELGMRSLYSKEAMKRMSSGYNIFPHGSVSRNRIREEISTSEIMAYPLDAVHYTETFGVSILEACASGTVPVICADDCFKELWSPVSLFVEPPYEGKKSQYTEKLLHALNSESLKSHMSDSCRKHSEKFEWSILTDRLEQTILTRGKEGLPSYI